MRSRQKAAMSSGAALGFTAVGWNGIYLAEVARVVPIETVGAATGGVLMFTFLGIVLGPSSFAAIVAMTGSHAAALVALDALVLVTVVAPLARRGPGGGRASA